jgi:chromosome segregation ATPase
MNKHHDELVQQFQSLMDIRNEVKQSFGSTSSNEKQVSCTIEIDKWEQEMIERIQQIATKSRMNVNEIILKHMNEVSHRFEELSTNMQQREKEGSYLENDIERVKNQLDQLKNDIQQVNEKIRIDFTISKSIEWDTLISIVEEEAPDDKMMKEENKSTLKAAASKNISYIILMRIF